MYYHPFFMHPSIRFYSYIILISRNLSDFYVARGWGEDQYYKMPTSESSLYLKQESKSKAKTNKSKQKKSNLCVCIYTVLYGLHMVLFRLFSFILLLVL